MTSVPAPPRTTPFVSLDRDTWSRLSDEIEVPLTSAEIEECASSALHRLVKKLGAELRSR